MMLTSPPALLRIEEGAVLLATLFVYRQLHFNWLLFALLFLTPDLFMLGYLLTSAPVPPSTISSTLSPSL